MVNPISSSPIASAIAVEEAFEVMLQFNNLCGRSTSLSLMSPGVLRGLHAQGRDLVRFGVLMRELR